MITELLENNVDRKNVWVGNEERGKKLLPELQHLLELLAHKLKQKKSIRQQKELDRAPEWFHRP